MRYRVEFSPEAAEDVQRLFEHVLERELNSPTGDLEVAGRALQAIRDSVELLTLTPFSCRKVGSSPFLRELVIPFGASGYVALFDIVGSDRVIVGAVRHQREDDYH
ncbi:MAG TPA: plasmid stabilization protein [Comamonadaceae bacterium]|nr:plasmid stabilization protein [Comamonadaceae bacterium]